MAEEQQQQPLWQLSAVAAVELLKSEKVTPLQLVEAAEQRWRVRHSVAHTPVATLAQTQAQCSLSLSRLRRKLTR